jgi:DNA-binding LytR/AlgR family response regulator
MGNLSREILSGNTYDIQLSRYEELVSALEIKLLKCEELEYLLVEIAEEMGLTDMSKVLREDDQIFVDHEGIQSLLRAGDIKYITANGKTSNIFVSKNKIVSIKKTVSNLGDFLPSSIFARVNRSVIINLNFVEKITKCGNGNYSARLCDIETPIVISRRYIANVKNNKY